MTFRIPNTPDTAYSDQAEPDAGDFAALGERGTGVITGCAVTAQGSPALAVDTSAGTVVVAGAPLTVSGSTLSIEAGEANPRFDLIVVNAAGATAVLKGTAGTNPVFPAFNPSTHCMLAAVYVRQSAANIITTDITDKRVTVSATFRRAYTDDVTEAVAVTNNTAKTFKLFSSGKMSWMSSILQRLSDSSMEFATSLVIKAADSVTNTFVLALKARATTPESQKVLDIQTSAGATVASIAGNGQGFFDNLKSGTGTPEGAVVGTRGDIYIDRGSANANSILWVKTSTSGNTGWQPLGAFSSTGRATGILFEYIGSAASPPSGSLFCDGAQYSATDPLYVDLYNLIGVSYGGTVGVNFNLPDLRGMTLIGTGGGANLGLGQQGGSLTKTLAIADLPAHAHPVIDNGHTHPELNYPYIWKPPSEPQQLRALPNGALTVNTLQIAPSVPYMGIQPPWFDKEATTGIAVGPTGGGQSFGLLQPVQAVNICVWL